MQKLNEKDLKLIQDILDFDGIIMEMPHKDFAFYCVAEFFLYGVFINDNNDKEVHEMQYNREDGTMNGFSVTVRDTFAYDLDRYDYYQFKDLKDFCEWYISK